MILAYANQSPVPCSNTFLDIVPNIQGVPEKNHNANIALNLKPCKNNYACPMY